MSILGHGSQHGFYLVPQSFRSVLESTSILGHRSQHGLFIVPPSRFHLACTPQYHICDMHVVVFTSVQVCVMHVPFQRSHYVRFSSPSACPDYPVYAPIQLYTILPHTLPSYTCYHRHDGNCSSQHWLVLLRVVGMHYPFIFFEAGVSLALVASVSCASFFGQCICTVHLSFISYSMLV